MLQGLLKAEGYEVGRLHVSVLMKEMGIEAIYRRPKTSTPAPGQKIYPYLLPWNWKDAQNADTLAA